MAGFVTDAELSRMRQDAIGAMPDTCVVLSPIWASDGTGGGSVSYSIVGTVTCRFDPMAIYRGQPDLVGGAEGMFADYIVMLPWDAPSGPDKRLVYDGGTYEIRGLANTQSWRVMQRVYVVRVYPE